MSDAEPKSDPWTAEDIASAKKRPSYTISSGKTITCHKCGLTSANLNDVAHRYCGHCQLFHEED